MFRTSIIALILFLLLSANSFAGLGSSFYSSEHSGDGVVVTAVDIKDKGIHNLVISISFLRSPKESKIYKSDEYEKLINRLMVECRGIILEHALNANELKITDLHALKNNIQTDIEKRVLELKKYYLQDNNAEVIFSLSNFFLLEPKEK